jgi:hypothetical protein
MQFKTPGAPQQRRMMRQNAPGSPQPPMMQPNRPNMPMPQMQMKPPAGPQCPLANPQANGPKPPVVRPRVEAARQRGAAMGSTPEVAKIRHLKQAAEHLAAAGFTDHAAKAREEIGRMEAALKAAPAPPKKDKPQVKAPHEPKVMRDQQKPNAPTPDATARIVAELKKISKQMGELNARVRKLEAQDVKHD